MGQAKSKQSPRDALLRAGLTRPHDALLWAPKRFDDFTVIADGNSYALHEGEKVCLQLTVAGQAYRHGTVRNGFVVPANDNTGQLHRLLMFGVLRFSPWARVEIGDQVWVRAKVVRNGAYLNLNGAEWVDDEVVGRVKPVYLGKTGVISSQAVADAAAEAIQKNECIVDAVMTIREAFNGMAEPEILSLAGISIPLSQIIRDLHAPSSSNDAEVALRGARRIAVAYVRWAASEAAARPMCVDSTIRITGNLMRELVAGLPFALTDGDNSQVSAVREIIRLLAEPYPMDGLLSADVGAGKTVCYGLIAAACQSLGKKAAIIIPNTILVEQVVSELRKFFPATPIAEIVEGMTSLPNWTANPVLVGTSKVFGVAEKAGWIPDLLVIDEQQKTSEAQRNRLRAPHTNVLEATATPLPRSMAMLTHAGKSLIQVEAQHAVKRITTRIIDQSHKRQVFDRIKEKIQLGEQVAVIYPRVASSAEKDLSSVVSMGAMWEQHFPGQVAVIHGKMKDEEKSAIMARIKSEKVPVIVASSILEIGVTIKDLRFMVVVDADRHGVFTLHQFRGRLARHGGEGEFILYLSREVNEETMSRLSLLEQTNDGFQLADMEMEMKGFGDLAETDGSQSGKTPTLFRGVQLMPRDFNQG